jgi:hypothetical protein
MGLLDLLQQLTGGNADRALDSFTQQAPAGQPGTGLADQLGAGLAAAFRSDQTPPFAETVGQLFGMSSSTQQAGILNQLLGALGPGLMSAVAGGALGNMLAPGQNQVTPEQATQLTPEQVTEIATQAEMAQPGIVDRVGQFYAQHSDLIKMLGGVALTIALAKMKENATKR